MAGTQLGLKRKEISPHKVSLGDMPRTCGRLFLDSGAHGLYMRYVAPLIGSQKKYEWFYKDGKFTRRFRRYLDRYAHFIKLYEDGIDLYVTVDVIRNPQLSWDATRCLEDKGLKPVPVIHANTKMQWVDKYVESGHKYLGIGGLGQESTRETYTEWADKLFAHLCPKPSRLPIVKLHGFAMTSIPLMTRYPWYSVDSSRWAKAAGYSSILVPYKKQGEFVMSEMFLCCFSHREESLSRTGPHISRLPPLARQNVLDWLEEINVPLGRVRKKGKKPVYGALTQYHARAKANLLYFERLADWMPKWPWPFKTFVARGLHKHR
jgi:hypothetical protein